MAKVIKKTPVIGGRGVGVEWLFYVVSCPTRTFVNIASLQNFEQDRKIAEAAKTYTIDMLTH